MWHVQIALWYFIYLNEVLKLLSVRIKEETASDSEIKKKKTDTYCHISLNYEE